MRLFHLVSVVLSCSIASCAANPPSHSPALVGPTPVVEVAATPQMIVENSQSSSTSAPPPLPAPSPTAENPSPASCPCSCAAGDLPCAMRKSQCANQGLTCSARPRERDPLLPAEEPPFDRAAAVAAVNQAKKQISLCSRPDGPHGKGRIRLTFAPTGRVASAHVEQPFVGTPMGSCIAAVFRRAEVPRFHGSPVAITAAFEMPMR